MRELEGDAKDRLYSDAVGQQLAAAQAVREAARAAEEHGSRRVSVRRAAAAVLDEDVLERLYTEPTERIATAARAALAARKEARAEAEAGRRAEVELDRREAARLASAGSRRRVCRPKKVKRRPAAPQQQQQEEEEEGGRFVGVAKKRGNGRVPKPAGDGSTAMSTAADSSGQGDAGAGGGGGLAVVMAVVKLRAEYIVMESPLPVPADGVDPSSGGGAAAAVEPWGVVDSDEPAEEDAVRDLVASVGAAGSESAPGPALPPGPAPGQSRAAWVEERQAAIESAMFAALDEEAEHAGDYGAASLFAMPTADEISLHRQSMQQQQAEQTAAETEAAVHDAADRLRQTSQAAADWQADSGTAVADSSRPGQQKAGQQKAEPPEPPPPPEPEPVDEADMLFDALEDLLEGSEDDEDEEGSEDDEDEEGSEDDEDEEADFDDQEDDAEDEAAAVDPEQAPAEQQQQQRLEQQEPAECLKPEEEKEAVGAPAPKPLAAGGRALSLRGAAWLVSVGGVLDEEPAPCDLLLPEKPVEGERLLLPQQEPRAAGQEQEDSRPLPEVQASPKLLHRQLADEAAAAVAAAAAVQAAARVDVPDSQLPETEEAKPLLNTVAEEAAVTEPVVMETVKMEPVAMAPLEPELLAAAAAVVVSEGRTEAVLDKKHPVPGLNGASKILAQELAEDSGLGNIFATLEGLLDIEEALHGAAPLQPEEAAADEAVADEAAVDEAAADEPAADDAAEEAVECEVALSVTCPDDTAAGDLLIISTDADGLIEIVVPFGVQPGDVFEVVLSPRGPESEHAGQSGDEEGEESAELELPRAHIQQQQQQQQHGESLEDEVTANVEQADAAPVDELEPGIIVEEEEEVEVEGTLKAEKKATPRGRAATLCGRVFDAYDSDKSGYLSEAEGKRYLLAMEPKTDPMELNYFWLQLLAHNGPSGTLPKVCGSPRPEVKHARGISKAEFVEYVLSDQPLDDGGDFLDQAEIERLSSLLPQAGDDRGAGPNLDGAEGESGQSEPEPKGAGGTPVEAEAGDDVFGELMDLLGEESEAAESSTPVTVEEGGEPREDYEPSDADGSEAEEDEDEDEEVEDEEDEDEDDQEGEEEDAEVLVIECPVGVEAGDILVVTTSNGAFALPSRPRDCAQRMHSSR